MAKRCGRSQSMVSRIWRAFALQPYRVEGFRLSKAPLFIEKVRDIVGLYLHPPNGARVVRRREQPDPGPRSQSAAVADAPRPGGAACSRLFASRPTNLFAALYFKAGTVIGQFHRRHRAVEFHQFLEAIDHQVPRRCALHWIIDDYATHKTPAIQRWLLRHPRFQLHFMPTGASWLNLVERWFAGLTEKLLRRGVHRSTRELQDAIRHESVARFCKRTSDSGH